MSGLEEKPCISSIGGNVQEQFILVKIITFIKLISCISAACMR